jgi:hypothetical protein
VCITGCWIDILRLAKCPSANRTKRYKISGTNYPMRDPHFKKNYPFFTSPPPRPPGTRSSTIMHVGGRQQLMHLVHSLGPYNSCTCKSIQVGSRKAHLSPWLILLTWFIYLFILQIFKNTHVTSNFAKLYHRRHIIWWLATAIWYGDWGCYSVPTAVS